MSKLLLFSVAVLSVGALDAAPPAAAVEVHKELHAAKLLLENANHDYDGHRAKAVEEIHLALKTLGHHHKPGTAKAATKPTAPKGEAGKLPAVHEAQAASDEQVKEARTILKSVEKLLSASADAKHQKALVDVSKAIEEIDLALKAK